MAYKLVIPKKVQKEIEKIDLKDKPRFEAVLVRIQENPFIGKKLSGEHKNARSYKVWPYRILYEIIDNDLIILVIRIGHRQGVYKK
jgi:mRNA interferase RelE/StbE